MFGEPEDPLDMIQKRSIYKCEYKRDVGIWDEENYDPHKTERKIIAQEIKKETSSLRKEINSLRDEIVQLKENASIPKSFIKDWDNDSDDIWDEY